LDGVVNSTSWWLKRTPEQRKFDESGVGIMGGVDPEAVVRLHRLLDESQAKVVVSSTIRRMHSFVELREILGHYGVRTTEFIGITPYLGTDRGLEIQAYLDQYARWERHGKLESLVILDDDSDMAHLRPRLVKTTSAEGLQDDHVEAALSLFRASPA